MVYRDMESRYAQESGCLESPDSPEYKKWLESLPAFLRSIVLDDLKERGINPYEEGSSK